MEAYVGSRSLRCQHLVYWVPDTTLSGIRSLDFCHNLATVEEKVRQIRGLFR